MRIITTKMLAKALGALALLLAASAALAQGSESFDHSWHVLSGGGAPSSSASFAADSSLGQWAAGAESGDYRVESGYWSAPMAWVLVGDIDGDGQVDLADIMLVTSRWRCASGDGCYNSACDVNGDGIIDVADIMLVAAHWGETCP